MKYYDVISFTKLSHDSCWDRQNMSNIKFRGFDAVDCYTDLFMIEESSTNWLNEILSIFYE